MTRRRRKRRKALAPVVRRLQHLVGMALGAYMDDRSPDRAGKVMGTLREAFDLCIEALEDYDDPAGRQGA